MAASCLCLLVLILGLLWLVWLWHQRRPPQSHPAAVRTTLQRPLNPRTSDDCPACRQQKPSPIVETPTRLPIRPWSEVKSRRGAPKHVDFVRTHEPLRVALAQPIDLGGKRTPQRYRERTPAMAAGLTNRRWTVRELLALPMAPELAVAA